MLDRDNAVFSVPSLQFPSRKQVGQHLKETLVDGVSRIDGTMYVYCDCDVVLAGNGV